MDTSEDSKIKKRAKNPATKNNALKAVVSDNLDCWLKTPDKAMRSATATIKKSMMSVDNWSEGIDQLTEAELLIHISFSRAMIPGYATVHSEHAMQLASVADRIQEYFEDPSQRRPLNFLLIASPGAGKSHMIDCLAKRVRVKGVQSITFNMAALEKNEDLATAIDAARNLKIDDRFPILFLDEFDTDWSRLPLLLPLLWDGAFQIGQRDLRIGRSVFFLAGSHRDLPEAVDNARSMLLQPPVAKLMSEHPKLSDLLSRINGQIVHVPKFSGPYSEDGRDSDKVCIVAALLRRRFGQQLTRVSLAFLRFVANITFQNDVRSLTHLVDCIPYQEDLTELNGKQLQKLPLKDCYELSRSSLASHLAHQGGAKGISIDWTKMNKCNQTIFIAHEALDGVELHQTLSDRYKTYLSSEIISSFPSSPN